jgi:hypothetical protein
MNIWIWFLILFSSTILFLSFVDDNIQFILKNKINSLPILFFILIVSSIFNYIALRTFKGEAEAFSTAILSIIPAFIYNYIIGLLKEDNQNYLESPY